MGLISKPATCACGQVIYEASDAFTGSLLTCSWCDRHYRYLGKGKLQQLSNSEYEAALIAPPYQERMAAAAATATAEPKSEPDKKTEKLIEPVAPRAKVERTKRGDGSGIPGGIMPMIAFIMLFNAIAFVALAYLLPRIPDGSRVLAWNQKVTIPKSVIPEVVTLVIAHFFGFLAWAVYVWRKYYRKREQQLGASPLKPLEIES